MISRATLASSFLRTLVLDQVLSNRARLARWQRWNLERLRRHALSRVPFYRALGTIEFADFPIVSKSDVMARFEDFNCTALSAQQAWDMVDAGTAPPGFDVGCSTGTSGCSIS